MKTILQDANALLPLVRRRGYRAWFAHQATAMDFRTTGNVDRSHAPVRASVNHGRWIVNCPFCSGAELVTLDDPAFLCLSCGNREIGGGFIAVQFPSENDRKQIEALLINRPSKNRNWEVDETINKLRDENTQHRHKLRGPKI